MAGQDRRDVPHGHVVGHSGVWQPQVGAPRADSPLGYREPGAAPRQDIGTGGYFNPAGYGSGFGAGGSETRASLDEHSEGAYGARSGARASMTAGRGPGGGVNVDPGFDPAFDRGAPRGGFPQQGPTHDWGPNRMAGERRWREPSAHDERHRADEFAHGNRYAESERYSGGEDRHDLDRGSYAYRDVGWAGARQEERWVPEERWSTRDRRPPVEHRDAQPWDRTREQPTDWRPVEHWRSDQPHGGNAPWEHERGRDARGGAAPALDPQRRRGPKNYQRSDERLRELISEKLIDHPYVDASDVSVTVVSGEVVLEGTVEDRHTKYLVEEQIDGIHGVRDVDNRLKVRRGFLAGMFGGHGGSREHEHEHGGWTTKGSASSEGPATDQSGGSQGGTHQYGRPT